MDLFSPVTDLRGVGAVRARQLQKLSIRTIYDLLALFPRAYEDRTNLVPIAELQSEQAACFRAFIVSEPRTSRVRKGMELTRVQAADETGRVTLVFFNQSYVKDSLRYAEEYYFYGRMDESYGRQITNPDFEKVGLKNESTNCILPVYPLSAGLSNRFMLSLIRQALDACGGALAEILPESVRRQYRLCGVQAAYENVHRPQSVQALEQAKRRLVFEEFFIFSYGLAALRAKRAGTGAEPYDCGGLSAFYSLLPFRLTDAQARAIDEICGDLQSGRVMNRLVQGDVGSGKTLVAAAACLLAVQNGRQAALMAPTEILAQQHYDGLTRLFAPLGVRILLLTGSMSAAAKREAAERIASGDAQLVIGTHALFSERIVFSALGLVVADEQHRFGVAQRSALAAKGASPHLLVMSATPIPRTLALIAYGDLDLSCIDELPPGRQPVDTFLVGEDMRARINGFIRKQCAQGHQVYIVCPAVEEDDGNDLKSAQVWAQTLQTAVFPDLKVGLLHGKMKGPEKEQTLGAFSRKELDILVATTVVEVGVDVPNATLMVVENAERFGLSQLHQLRGRVGRGGAKSYCVLFSSSKSAQTQERLRALCKTNDGFQIAQEDLAMRGPGDFFGSRQHGLPLFRAASLQMDLQTLKDAQQAAAGCIQDAASLDAPELAPLKQRIDALFQQTDVTLN